MTLSSEERNALILHKLEKAERTQEEVLFLIENDRLTTAVNRVYYGIFYALSALALNQGFQTVKHQQLIGWFNKTFVKGGGLDPHYGKILINTYDKRSKGDYDDFVEFEKDEVLQLHGDMIDFIRKIKELIGEFK
ncbi:MAG: HEPN domain-containing protein [Spirochaetota bacterium]